MKYSKQQSLSTDTRLSRSGIFNNSSLNNSNAPLETNHNFYMSNNIQNSENKEVQFLRIKNAQLEEKNRRLQTLVKQLEDNKAEILAINSKYVDVVNRYYEDQNNRTHLDKSGGHRKIKDPSTLSNSQAHRTLEQLQRDHRNLVKHCLAMEQQIKNYTSEMEKFETMKKQLQSVNHASVKDLIEEIEDLAEENRELRKNNNHITYQLEKSKQECKKVKRVHQAKEKEAGDSSAEIAKMRSLINTTQQQSLDKSNAYESRIYDLELKVEKLEKELRESQQTFNKTRDLHKNLEIKQVEQVHDYEKLQNSVADLLKNRERALSQYSKSRSSHKNVLELALNSSIQRNKISANMSVHNNVKNQRRSLAQKSYIAA